MSGAPSLSVAFVAFLLVASVAANGWSTQYKGHTKHPTIPEHCLYDELDLAVPLHGKLLPSGHDGYCIRLECTDDYLLIIRHCDKQPFPKPGCHLSANDYDLQFPDCCPQLECSSGF
ncbi:uncharacterized protein LOC108111866 [Drosophila eugracilis]|uniref:uncharacterized protein LOC108111866 n=1 Tax=Drosophila eugracilis TaxID=29029 RepID=UPI0007E6B36B|nr:uncharacterized protein LOC108111866 [Drosophila eugracilis]